MGLSDLSLEWLVALTKNGEDISGYEYDIVDLILDWLSEVLDIRKLDHRLAIRVLQLAQQLVKSVFSSKFFIMKIFNPYLLINHCEIALVMEKLIDF